VIFLRGSEVWLISPTKLNTSVELSTHFVDDVRCREVDAFTTFLFNLCVAITTALIIVITIMMMMMSWGLFITPKCNRRVKRDHVTQTLLH